MDRVYLQNELKPNTLNFSQSSDMGASLHKQWQEMGEVEDAGKEREVREKEGNKQGKIKLKDRLRTKILRGDPR